jgi:hypothetical protein
MRNRTMLFLPTFIWGENNELEICFCVQWKTVCNMPFHFSLQKSIHRQKSLKNFQDIDRMVQQPQLPGIRQIDSRLYETPGKLS